MLTIEKLKKIKPNTTFNKGIGLITHPWFGYNQKNLVNEKGEQDKNGIYVEVKWIAHRGGIHDWCIYHSLDANFITENYLDGFDHLKVNWDSIQHSGAKLHNKKDIKKLIKCTDEAFDMYRH